MRMTRDARRAWNRPLVVQVLPWFVGRVTLSRRLVPFAEELEVAISGVPFDAEPSVPTDVRGQTRAVRTMSAMHLPRNRVCKGNDSNRLIMTGIGVPRTSCAMIRARTGGAGR
jgi:hypothetical protein